MAMKLHIISPKISSQYGKEKIEHNPGCFYEEWDKETRALKRCGRHSVVRDGTKGDKYLCEEHARWAMANDKGTQFFIETLDPKGNFDGWVRVYDWQRFVRCMNAQAEKWDKQYTKQPSLS